MDSHHYHQLQVTIDTLTQKIRNLEHELHNLRIRIGTGTRITTQMNPTVEGNISAIEISPNQFEPLRGQMAQNYGFASRPVSGCHHFVITVNGNSGSALSIATNDTRYRPQTLAEGETTMHDNAGQYVLLQGGQNITILANQNINVSCSGAIEIDSPNGIKIVSPTVHMTGNLNVDGDVTGNNGAVSLDSHVHTNVTTGSNNSGKPYGGV